MTPAAGILATRQAAAVNARGYSKIKMVAASSNSRRSFVQTFMFWTFRLATYFVLACATYIFLDIAIKGSRTVFTNHAPFINVKFLTEPPQTLYVFEYQGKKMELSDREFRKWQETHKEPVDATSIAYSAGGIWPCIVGTALLVVGSMIVALIIGISAAIYLSEYSRETRFIRFIRVAILNLAGVPSIVFGLFGFGLFVIFWVERFAASWLVHAGSDDFAGNHYRQRRIVARGAERFARGFAGPWRDELANHPQKRSALCDAGHFDILDTRYRACGG